MSWRDPAVRLVSTDNACPGARAFLQYVATFQIMDIYRLNGILADAAAPQTAQPATPGAPTSPAQSILGSPIIFIGLIFVMMYFIVFRPQSQQRKKQAEMLKTLKSGDKVVTSSGIVGVVITVKDTTVSLRSADAKMEVTKPSVTQILENGAVTES
jgi:preprotein translocase subunit YajC